MSAPVPIIRAAGEGDKQSFLGGGLHTWKLMAEDTDGAFFLFEDAHGAGQDHPAASPSRGRRDVYVLEGEIIVNVDGNETRVGAGGMSFVPKGVPHAFLVVSDRARLLTLQSPGDRPSVLPRRQRAGDRRHLRHGRHRSRSSIRQRERRHRTPRAPTVSDGHGRLTPHEDRRRTRSEISQNERPNIPGSGSPNAGTGTFTLSNARANSGARRRGVPRLVSPSQPGLS